MKNTSSARCILRFAFLLLAAAEAAAGLDAERLRCEGRADPLGIDVTEPQLSWVLRSTDRGAAQTAYQVLAASKPELLTPEQADLWNSGEVTSPASLQIAYAGRALVSAQEVFWKVRVWDRDGRPSAWTAPTRWTMGVLAETDWRGTWIGSAGAEEQTLVLRREFAVRPGLRRALAQVCGLGCFELSINGGKVGDDLFPSGWTKYDRTCLYETYDITAHLRPGANAAGLLLGNGMYNVRGGRYAKFKGSFGPLQARGQLRLEYKDGTIETVGTDAQWRIAPGPITFSCVFGGEDYDARLDPPGWNAPGFTDSGWAAATVTSGPGGKLRGLSGAAAPIRAFDVLAPVQTTTLRPGVTVYDLGQNASLMPRLTVQGPAGAVVRIVPAELVKADGSVDRGSVGGGAAYWQYTLAGRGPEQWFPKFFYHGCRYLQVECSAPPGGELPVVESIAGVVVHSSAPPVGTFSCSNELFNRSHTLIRWAQRSNLMSVLTDCPHRERLGWLEEEHLNGPALRYEFDLAPLFAKAMNDMADSQLPSGLVPNIAPEYVAFRDKTTPPESRGIFGDSPEWSSAFLLVAWQQYEFTGDLSLLRRYYPEMARYAAYLGTRAQGGIVDYGLGDWYDLGPKKPGVAQLTPRALTATAFYYAAAEVLAKTAVLLGKTDDARTYAALTEQLRAAFNAKFFDPATGQYATGSQCANAIPLVMHLCPPERRAGVLAAIVQDVRGRGNALTAGDVGYRYLLRALAEGGRSDVVFDLNDQSEKPGYGYQLQHGATSLTEAWDAGRGSSQNHFMLGQLMEWFYHDLAGIQSASDGPGFQKIVIAPAVVGDVTWTRASYDSVRGQIVSEWRRDGEQFGLHAVIPANTSATIYLPAAEAAAVTESGQPVAQAVGVKFLRREPSLAVFEIEAGDYRFDTTLPKP